MRDDNQLVRAAKAGDFSAFEALVARHEQRIYTLAMRLVRHTQDAEDVVQTTFLKALENLDRFRGDAAFGTWVARIATNTGLTLLKRKHRMNLNADEKQPPPIPEQIADWRDDLHATIERRELRRILDAAVDQLEEKYRLVFVLRDIEQMTTRETAEALEISEANVKVRLLRARLMLREKLTQAFGDATKVYQQPRDHDHDFPLPAADTLGETR